MSLRALVRQVLLLLALAGGAGAVHANPEFFVKLDYQPDRELVGCPSEAAFVTLITEQLGRDPFRAGAELKVVARAHPSERGLQGVVEWYDASGAPRGKRELGSDGTDCAALARAMSFAIVVQIQLLAQEEAQAPAGVPSLKAQEDRALERKRDSAEAVGPVVPPSDRASPRPKAEYASWQFMLGAGPALAFGLAPRTAIEGRAFGGARRRRFGFELGAEASLPSRYTTPSGDGFDQQVFAGSLAGCAFLGGLSGCLVSKLGKLSVRGFGVDDPNSASGTLVQLGPRLTFGENFGDRWAGALRVEALATLVTWEVTLNEREVWSTPSISFLLGGDIALLFP